MQVLAFRAASHNLAQRLPHNRLTTAAAAVGIRDGQGSGIHALHSRVVDARRDDLDGLVAVASARGVTTLVPEPDIATFTIGTVPADETLFGKVLASTSLPMPASSLSDCEFRGC